MSNKGDAGQELQKKIPEQQQIKEAAGKTEEALQRIFGKMTLFKKWQCKGQTLNAMLAVNFIRNILPK